MFFKNSPVRKKFSKSMVNTSRKTHKNIWPGTILLNILGENANQIMYYNMGFLFPYS